MTDQDKALIELVAEKAATLAVEKHEALGQHEKRIQVMERKVFNGFGTHIVWMRCAIGALFAGLGTIAFYLFK